VTTETIDALDPLTDAERAQIRLRMAQWALSEREAAAQVGVSRPTLRKLLDPQESVRPWVRLRARRWLQKEW
jgi:predicted DNA-binding protein (UPF0251 family)